jgi:hypothetical protein
MVQTIPDVAQANPPVRHTSAAHHLDVEQRQQLALQALAGSFTITYLADQTQVSRKFVYQQLDRAQEALDQAFAPRTTPDDQVLFSLPVTKRWLQQVVLALQLIGRCSFRGVLEFCRDCLDCPLSLGTIANIVADAVVHARHHNDQQRLEQVRLGLLDEIFQHDVPVLVGVDAASTYCFLLSQEDQRDAITWGVRLLELHERGCQPEAFVADFGEGLRAGLDLALPEIPCWGDVFHALYTVRPVVTILDQRAYEAIAHRSQLERQGATYQRRQGHANLSIVRRLRDAKPQEQQAITLADDVALLARWLRDDILALAGPSYADRCTLYDFVLAELRTRAPLAPTQLNPLCTFLKNHRDKLLAFAQRLDQELATLANAVAVSVATLRELLRLHTGAGRHGQRWPREADLRRRLRGRFYVVSEAVRALAERTVRASSAVENLNSRLRTYFTLRRHLGPDYLTLLQFFLNHRRFLRSDRPERVGKSPAELLTGHEHPHWLELLGYERFCRA